MKIVRTRLTLNNLKTIHSFTLKELFGYDGFILPKYKWNESKTIRGYLDPIVPYSTTGWRNQMTIVRNAYFEFLNVIQ
jgi:hypothetical protein